MSNAELTVTHRRGVYKNMPIEEYHAAEGISNSGISLLLDAPKKYWHHYLNPENLDAKGEESKALALGSAVHTLALEPKLFEQSFAVFPKIDRRTKAGKEQYTRLNELHIDKHHINEEDFLIVDAMAKSIRSNPAFMRVVDNGHIEESLFWQQNGVTLRARPDFYNEFLVIDIKTTESARRESFMQSIINYGYHRQAAMQLDGLRELTGREYKYFAFLAVEKKPPYLNAMYLLDIEAIEQGRQEYLKAIDIYRFCLQENNWPGYSDKLEPINLPQWYYTKN